MAANDLKKMMIFSNANTKKLIDNLTKDEALMTGKSNSAILEDAILKYFLTDNEKVNYYIELLYSGDEKEISSSIAIVLNAIFDTYAAGLYGKPAYDNGKEFVEFALNDLVIRNNKIFINKNNENHIHYFLDKVNIMKECLEKEQESREIKDTRISEMITYFTEFVTRTPESIFYYKDSFLAIYTTILEFWSILSANGYTYRLMSIMTHFQTFSNTPEARLKLRKIIEETVKEWK